MIILFKGCSKCKGDMHLTQDVYGSYVQCIQCGRISELGQSGKQYTRK